MLSGAARRHKVVTFVGLLATLALALSAPAEAGWRMDRAKAIAEIVWQHCPGQLEIRFADPASRGLDPQAAGWADEGGCVVYLNPRHEWMRHWETFCTEVIHEAGHAATFRDWSNTADPRHSSREGSVMNAHPAISITGYRTMLASGRLSRRRYSFDGTDSRCARRGRPYLERHLRSFGPIGVALASSA